MNRPLSLQVSHLSYSRSDRCVLNGIHFTLVEGQLLHIVGENGSGKTSLLRILLGLIQADAGDIAWSGLHDNAGVDALYMGHQTGVRSALTVKENLLLLQALSATDARRSVDAALDVVGLSSYAEKQAHTLSAGQQRRLVFARLLLSSARVWFLDEPLTALDKQGVQLLEHLMCEHLNQNGMILMTSHQPFEIESQWIQTLVLS